MNEKSKHTLDNSAECDRLRQSNLVLLVALEEITRYAEVHLNPNKKNRKDVLLNANEVITEARAALAKARGEKGGGL